MTKMILSKQLFKKVEEAFKCEDDILAINFLMSDNSLSDYAKVKGVKAYLNEDGYELEATPEEKALAEFNKYNGSCSIDDFERGWDIGFVEGMKWMNKNFNLKLDFLLNNEYNKSYIYF